jgi:hypothetical protein
MKRIQLSILILAIGGLVLPQPVRGQGTTLPFDWSTRPKEAGKSVDAPTLQLSSKQQVTIKIVNVNDMFYSYNMGCTSTLKSSGLDELTGLFLKVQGESDSDCDKKAAALDKEITDYLNTPEACGSNCTSVPLEDVQTRLTAYRQQIDLALACQPSTSWVSRLKDLRAQIQTLLDKPHFVTFPATIAPDYDYSCTITEYYKQQPTKNGTLTISIKLANTIITLSVGPLFSAIRNRTYTAITAPNADASGTSNVLGVQGNSFSTAIAALANFRIPWRKLSSDKFGLDLAAGPVVRLNSKSGSSSAGFFGGVSIRLYRYLFLTPGFHVGEFPDFPQGFNRVGQPLPPNFPTPAPVTRTTAKFGVAITFQTKDFSALGKSTATATTTPAAKPATTGSPKPPAAGGDAATTLTVSGGGAADQKIDLGTLGATAITKSVTLKNGASGPLGSLTLQGNTQQVSYTESPKCAQLAVGATCTLNITLKPGTGNPQAAILIATPDGTQETLVLTWTRQN